MLARIYQPARNAMTSGQAKTKTWVLEFSPEERRSIDPLMGWTSSSDTQSQVRLQFGTKEEAIMENKRLLDYITKNCANRCVREAGKGKHTLDVQCKK